MTYACLKGYFIILKQATMYSDMNQKSSGFERLLNTFCQHFMYVNFKVQGSVDITHQVIGSLNNQYTFCTLCCNRPGVIVIPMFSVTVSVIIQVIVCVTVGFWVNGQVCGDKVDKMVGNSSISSAKGTCGGKLWETSSKLPMGDNATVTATDDFAKPNGETI
ncbi:uncharacterized protein LACBIDRAFT_333023 [Laccaria bicolor S238N-H82]|uniref:Predicted protein n=1 Tax=Laccaria bicolor (strain S238N-H82 / ATCC MYA-4686) TaxID=486041 RepID=B0DUL3_LACBS|nr:uncharacterized protein LACBIDRAFT_333023 [Laccaria bicolor S238N-H82]EDR01764.1 predicted protein [Laccaria bicolor S238N-H82]|eukprot:XP_001887577.1 predicted protein [Laccaria bicolor S238N-H82]